LGPFQKEFFAENPLFLSVFSAIKKPVQNCILLKCGKGLEKFFLLTK